MSDDNFEERLRALRERIDGYRLIDYKPHSSGNGGRWSEFLEHLSEEDLQNDE